MCRFISRENAAKNLQNVSMLAAGSGLLIAICGLTVVSWKSITPKANKCIETWPPGNYTTQCTFDRNMYNKRIPDLDKSATVAVSFIQAGIAAVGFSVAVMFLPPWCAAYAKKSGHQWREKCCGFIACFTTFIGFGCAVACVVIPFSAKATLDSNICGPILPKMKKAKAVMGTLETNFCTEDCIAAVTAFIESLCGLGNKFMIIAGIGFLTCILASFAFLANAISCCVTSKGGKVEPENDKVNA